MTHDNHNPELEADETVALNTPWEHEKKDKAEENDEIIWVSRTEIKKDMAALQDLGVSIAKMPQSKRDTLPLPEILIDAIDELNRLKSNGAIRRQRQFIGKVMRQIDAKPIIDKLAELDLVSQKETDKHHLVEQWRIRLIHEGKDALSEFVDQYPDIDVQQLRQHIRKAQNALKTGKDNGGAKAVFRLIREVI